MGTQRFVMRFPGAESDRANQYARSLANSLRDSLEPGCEITVSRDNPESMDFGATVVLILGTTAATAIAEGIRSWLKRNSGAQIELLSDGTVRAKNLGGSDAAEIAKAFSRKE